MKTKAEFLLVKIQTSRCRKLFYVFQNTIRIGTIEQSQFNAPQPWVGYWGTGSVIHFCGAFYGRGAKLKAAQEVCRELVINFGKE